MTPLQTAAQQALHQMAMENWNWASNASNNEKRIAYVALQKALEAEQAQSQNERIISDANASREGFYKSMFAVIKGEQAQAVEPVAWISKHGTLYLLEDKDAVDSINELQPLYLHPAPPAGEQIDWQDMYLKAKSEKEAMAAKYEKDIGPLARVEPATGERAELIAVLRSKYRDTKQMLPIDYCHGAADMLEADAALRIELARRTVERDMVIRMAAEGSEIYGNEAQQVAVPATIFNAVINFAINQSLDAREFLEAWREGDTSEWPEFTHPAPPAATGERAKVGDSRFESWYSESAISHERKQAMREAYEAGMNDRAQQVAVPASGGEWRKLALQFDGHRMQALWHLRAMTLNPNAHMSEAMKFLAAPPEAQQVAVPVPMSDEQICDLWRDGDIAGGATEFEAIARIIEAHHGIGAKP